MILIWALTIADFRRLILRKLWLIRPWIISARKRENAISPFFIHFQWSINHWKWQHILVLRKLWITQSFLKLWVIWNKAGAATAYSNIVTTLHTIFAVLLLISESCAGPLLNWILPELKIVNIIDLWDNYPICGPGDIHRSGRIRGGMSRLMRINNN